MDVDVDSSGTIPVVQRDGNISLYDHQKEAYKKLSDWSRRQEKEPAGLLVLPTGGGKTLTATYWLMQNVLSKGKKILWIAHQYTLLEQAYHSFEMVCYRNISIGGKSSYSYRIVSGIHASAYSIRPDDDILIASKASLSIKKDPFRIWLEKNRDNFYFIIDEAHHAPAQGYRNLIDDMRKHGGKFFMLGLTATPFRTAEEEKGWMKKVFPDDILYGTSISNLTAVGILSEANFKRIRTDIDMQKWFERNNAAAVYNRIISNSKFDLDGNGKDATLAASLIAENQARNALIVKTYKDNRSEFGKTLVFALNRAMAKTLYEYFIDANIRANYVISNREDGQDNNTIINDFKANKFDVLINVRIVTEGVDVPNVKTVFLTRPTKSKILMTQMIGRGLRGKKVGGTAKTCIVDFLDEWRDELVAWVIPEKLYKEEKDAGAKLYDKEKDGGATLPPPVVASTGVKYTPTEEELSEWEILHTISEETLAEFIRLANSKFDLSLFKQFSLIERVPLGYYRFEYDVIGNESGSGTKTCNVMVYDCMKSKFDELIDWLNNHPNKKSFAVDSMVETMADEIDEKFFGKREELLGYSKENIYDILRFYSQNENDSPKFIEFAKRAEYDVSALAQHVADATYIEDEWNRPDGKWKNFFGEQNKMAFLAAITAEVAKSAGLLNKPTNALTAEEIQIAEKVPLDVLVTRHSDIYEKIRDAVYENSRENGEYVDSQSGRRSKSRLDFEIGYKTPLNAGGKTDPANLRLVYMGASQYLPNTTWEDMPLSEIEHIDPARYKRICNAVYGYYQFRNGDYYDKRNNRRSDNRLDFKIDYEVPLNAGGKTVPANLYLVYKKSDSVILPPPPPPSAVNFKTVDDLFDRFAKSTNGQEKLAIKNEILAALSKLKEAAQQNRDAVAMNKIGIYYAKAHEHNEADRCYSVAESFQVITNGEPIPDTNLTWHLDDNGTLTISGTGDMKDWDNEKNPSPWYGQRAAVEKIIIKDGVTSIGNNAFEHCHSLTSIVIPDSVISIGDWAFELCRSLENVVIPNSVKFICDWAFVWCESLTSITLPDNVTIDNAVFIGCTSLKKIDQPSKVIFCDNLFVYEKKSDGLKINSFIGTLGVSVAVIPDSVTAISDFAFSYCDLLKEIFIPNSVTSIGDCAFKGCELLTNATLSPSVKKIGYSIFSDCKKLQSIRYKHGLDGAEKLLAGNSARVIPY